MAKSLTKTINCSNLKEHWFEPIWLIHKIATWRVRMSEKNKMTYLSDVKIHFMTLFDSGFNPLPSSFMTKF